MDCIRLPICLYSASDTHFKAFVLKHPLLILPVRCTSGIRNAEYYKSLAVSMLTWDKTGFKPVSRRGAPAVALHSPLHSYYNRTDLSF